MQKIGMLGGTFNPIHNSHIYLAEQFRDRLALDKLFLIPTYIPPHKRVKDLADSTDRLAMCRLAAEGLSCIEVCDYEIAREGTSYTYQTLEYLQSLHPDAALFLLMGADMFLTVQDWREPGHIYRLATLCAAAREPGEHAALKEHEKLLAGQGAACILLEITPKPLSSTEIREKIARGESVRGLVPDKVLEYIEEHHLYGED